MIVVFAMGVFFLWLGWKLWEAQEDAFERTVFGPIFFGVMPGIGFCGCALGLWSL